MGAFGPPGWKRREGGLGVRGENMRRVRSSIEERSKFWWGCMAVSRSFAARYEDSGAPDSGEVAGARRGLRPAERGIGLAKLQRLLRGLPVGLRPVASHFFTAATVVSYSSAISFRVAPWSRSRRALVRFS